MMLKPEILMFRHPLAGIQLAKGTVEPSENPTDAARRELFEESGIDTKQPLFFIGKNTRMVCGQIWYFYHLDLLCTRNQWSHFAPDNGGIELQFFGHALLPTAARLRRFICVRVKLCAPTAA